MRRAPIVLLLVTLGVSGSALAEQHLFQFRSIEDPGVVADPLECANAPFKVNMRMAASLWTVEARASDGKVSHDRARRIGTVTACGEITNLAFPSGLQQRFYARFKLPSGSYTAVGTCTLISNDVPKGGVVLAGCNLRLASGPSGSVGGTVVGNSVFNPFRLPGVDTTSSWTLLVYDDAPAKDANVSHEGHAHDMELVDDPRFDEASGARSP